MRLLVDIIGDVIDSMATPAGEIVYTAWGAGIAEANGDYNPQDDMIIDTGDFFSPMPGVLGPISGYKHSINECFIVFRAEIWELWYLGPDGTVELYNAPGTSTSLPSTGWEAMTAGAGTAPTITGAPSTPAIPAPHYHYGHPLEIVNTFAEMVKSPTHKTGMFPAICLMMDFDEQMNVDGYESVSKPTIVILTNTDQSYKAAERYADTFKTVLYPLYELFLKKLDESTALETYTQVHTKTDRLYWGKKGIYGNVGNIFNDFIDAIEINDLEIRILKQC